MQRTNLTLTPLIAVLLATAAWSISTHARAVSSDAETVDDVSCRVAARPDVVPVTEAAVEISVVLPAAAGMVTEVRAEAGSGIEVLDFGPSESELDALAARLDVAAPVVGTWRVEFVGEEESCVATLTVRQSASAR